MKHSPVPSVSEGQTCPFCDSLEMELDLRKKIILV